MRNFLSDKVVEMKPSGIRKFFDIVSEMPEAISLGVGEPDFDTPWHIREEGIYSLEKGKTLGLVGETGAGKTSIARAILGGAPVLLLDECTSALDEQTERKVLERIAALPERSCIAVTHRPAAIALCDWQLEVGGGKLYAIQKSS